MRFQRLELLRYGGFADRILDFGDGRPDLHLIVGPNEAGKSTLLSAIADLLFGFPAQSTQDWQFDYKELRLRGLVQSGDTTLDVVRRKGSRNTLLAPDGTALADDALAPFVGGHDRTSFERMFGLDHAKLRAGGQAILEGRDEAARTLFQAGSGLGAVGLELKALEAKAGDLFKPNASNPAINALLKQRVDLLKRVRESSLGEAELVAIRQRLADAAAKRDVLIAEAEELGARANAVERVLRTRAPLGRLAAARDELERIGPTSPLPDTSAADLAAARTERTTARELLDRHRDEGARAAKLIAQIDVPHRLLAERARIEALDERRPAIEKGQADLARRATELDDLDAHFALAREEAGFLLAAVLPGESWQRRAARHVEASHVLDATAARLVATEATAAAEHRALEAKLALAPRPADPAALQAALTDIPADADDRLRKVSGAAERAQARADSGRSALRWPGSAQSLAEVALPSVAETAALARWADRIDAERQRGVLDSEAARRDAAEQQRRLKLLTAGPLLPTPEAVRDARQRRATALLAVRDALAAPARDAAAALDGLANAIVQADDLADRRDADAKRLAEAAVAAVALEEALGREAVADAALTRWTSEKAQADADWAHAAAALPSTLRAELTPAGFEGWRADRERVLNDQAEAAELAAARDELRADLLRAHDRLDTVMSSLVIDAPVADRGRRLREGQAMLVRLADLQRQRERLEAQLETVLGRTNELTRERHTLHAQRRILDEAGQALCTEGGIVPRSDALERAVEDSRALAVHATKRNGLQRQVEGITGDLATFGNDVAACLRALERPASEAPTAVVRALSHELATGLDAARSVAVQTAEATRAQAQARLAEHRVGAAQARIDALVQVAGVSAEADLDAALARAGRVAAARSRLEEAVRDLADGGEGHGIEALQAQCEALPPDAAASARDALASRRREIEAEREAIGRSLAQAQVELDRTAAQSLAAQARQEIAETQTALASAAEHYVEASAGAALLRWLIERHRASTQAPLLAGAGALFASVTQGAYTGLALDYDDNDRARIVALRADSSRVGVDGLSEGTRDQLFLALRLGALQHDGRTGARPAAALPLVCDDLLITADDARATAMLSVLAGSSRNLQILVFTHHEHLVEVAGRAIGPDGFVVHRLAPARQRAA